MRINELQEGQIIAKNVFISSITPVKTKTGCEKNWGRSASDIYYVFNLSDLEVFKTKISLYKNEVDGYVIDGRTYFLNGRKLMKCEKSADGTTNWFSTWGRQ